MKVPNEYLIFDSRSYDEFKTQTFCGYLVKEVVNRFNKCLVNSRLEEAVNWGVELLISNHNDKVWSKIFNIIFKNININNPKLPNLLYKRYAYYIKQINDKNHLRNNQKYRNLLVELCFIVCYSIKTKPLTLVKISEKDFDMNNLSTRLIANRNDIVKDKLKYGDPDELHIIMNEFNYCLLNRKYELCVYWLSWINEWEKKNTKKDKCYICAYREIVGVDKKYYNNVVWLIWEILLKEGNNNKNDDVNLQIHSLYKLYKYDFTSGKKSSRNVYFLYAIKYFTDNYSFNYEIYNNYYLYVRACANINLIFFEKNKHSKNNDLDLEKKKYLFSQNNIKKEIKEKKQKYKASELKKIADKKIQYKISKVEAIDSLIMNNSKHK